MKKCIILGLALLVLGTALFAEDAKVMPARVGRFYIAPNFTFANGVYDEDGKLDKDAMDGSVKIFNLGFALEYGIIDWITGAIQWVPGVTVWSDLEALTGKKDTNANGVADLFLGAKMQIIGQTAPVKSDMFRFAAAPGLKIPLPGPDFEKQVENLNKGDKATLNNMDNHVLAVGGRFYFDYIINKYFFINVYNETMINATKRDLIKAGPNLAVAKSTFGGMADGAAKFGGGLAQLAGDALNPLANPTIAGYGSDIAAAANTLSKAIDNIKGDVNYKYQLTFELEPVFSTNLAEGIVFTAGLPVNYKYKPAYKYSLDGRDELKAAVTALMGGIGNNGSAIDGYLTTLAGLGVPALGDPANALLAGLGSLSDPGNADILPALDSDSALLKMMGYDPKQSHALSINPNVSIFFMKFVLPLEFKYSYSIPIWGQNTQAGHTMAFQIRAYFKI